MADKSIINFFNKGLVRDTHPGIQDNQTYRYALNAIHEDRDSLRSGRYNERSNAFFAKASGTIVGHTFIEERDKFLLFHTQGGDSIISFLDTKTQKITRIASDREFGCKWGFHECEWIYGETKTMRPCNELHVYWSSNNSYYTANIDVLLNPKRRKALKCHDFELFDCICMPRIKARVMDGGGYDIVAGAYQFAAQLQAPDGNKTNWFYTNEPVYVTSENNQAGEPSTQSIQVTLSDLDPRYNKVNIAVVRTIGGTISIDQIHTLNYSATSTTNSNVSFVYYGTTGREQQLSINEIITRTRKYFRGKDLIQNNGQLFLYNLLDEHNLDYQRRANKIKTEWVAYRISHKDADIYKSLMRDETYALGIVWNYCDGTSSMAYHIPAPDLDHQVEESCNACNNVHLYENTARAVTQVAGDLFDISEDEFAVHQGGNTYTPGTTGTYPSAQDYDYDKKKAEVDAQDPTFPATDTTDMPDNAVTRALDNMKNRLGSVNTDPTCDCETCAEDECNDCHDLAKDMSSGAGDLISNLNDSATDDNSSVDPLQSGSELLDQVINKEEVRTNQKSGFYTTNNNLENPGSSGSTPNTPPATSLTGSGNTGTSNLDYRNRSKSLRDMGDGCSNAKPAEIDYGPTGVFKSTETYPLTLDCHGEYVYGDLAGKPIRHHRMPDNKTIPHFISTQNGVPNKYDVNNVETHNTDVIVLGLRLKNIKFPNDSELPKPLCPNSPYKIVFVQRDDTNKSVVAKGIFTHTFEGQSHGRAYAFPKHAVNSREYIDRSIVIDEDDSDKRGVDSPKALYNFHSPDTHYNTPGLAIDAIKPELEYFGSGWRHGLYAEGEKPYNIYENQVDQRGTRQALNLNHYKAPEDPKVRCVTGLTYAPGNKVVLNPSGIDLPLMNLWRESSVYLQAEGAPFVLKKGIDGQQASDLSFLGDGLHHECPIPYGGAIYGSLKRYIPNQYGSVVNLNYIDLGLNAHKGQGESIEGICGDTWIGMHQFRRTSYVSNKIGENIETEKLPEPKYTGIMKFFNFGDCTELPETGDSQDPKNFANLRPGEPCHVQHTDPGPMETDIYYPKVLKTLVSFWVESEVNTWNTARGEEKLGEIDYPRLKEIELDSWVNSVYWPDGYLNRFYVEVRRPSRWKLAVASFIRAAVNLIPASMLATDVFDINSTLDMGFSTLEALMTAGIWLTMSFLLFTPKNVRRLLGLPECEPDRRGGNLNEEVFQWEDNYKGYNYDYSISNVFNSHLGMPDPYNTCQCKDDVCNTPFTTNDIYYSNKQITDSPYDAYQNFEANDYLAIPADAGSLQRLFVESGRFYAHTTDGLFMIQYSNNSFQFGERIALLGQGNLIANPQKYMDKLEEGFLGLRDPNMCINTAFGYFFLDREAGILFKFQSGQAHPISAKGMYNFFKENFKGFCGDATCCDDERSTQGNYFAMGVDYRHNRILITKHDAKVPEHSMTLSYDPLEESWISFHSYIPRSYLWDRRRMWTLHGAGEIWEHHTGEGFTSFYGKQEPFILEFVARSENMQPVQYRSTILDTQADQGALLNRYVTFNKVHLRNTYQTSGLFNLIPRAADDKEDYTTSIYDKTRDRIDDIEIVREHLDWRFNEIHDYTSDHDQPLTKDGCSDCNTGLLVPDLSNVNYEHVNEQQYANRIMYDKYLIYRYVLDNTGDYRLLVKSNRTIIEEIIR